MIKDSLKLEGEIWVPVTGYELYYEVSNFGRVKSLNRPDGGNQYNQSFILKATLLKTGYFQVCLVINKVKKKQSVHRLVISAFLSNPSNKPQVNHIDGIKKNNHISNLEWCTPSENGLHAYKTGLSVSLGLSGEENHSCTHTKEQVLKIKNLLTQGIAMKDIAKIHGFNREYVKAIKYGKCWAWLKVA